MLGGRGPQQVAVKAAAGVDQVGERKGRAQSEQEGGIACHTGHESCFFRKLENGKWVEMDPVLKDPKLIYKK